MDRNSASPSQESRRGRVVFRALAVVLAGVIALVSAELFCRFSRGRVRGSERLEPGLIRYDRQLGWRLTPDWSGNHTHHDFEAHYEINGIGFRRDGPLPREAEAGFHAIVGDSFTFGLGVDDDKTFVSQLNRKASDLGAFVNFAVPGYSTDQEALLIEQEILDRRPSVLWLMVYVANDLLDNQRSVAMQVRLAKPYFELEDGKLHLRNTPVPRGAVPPMDPRRALVQAVFGLEGKPRGWSDRLADRSALAELLSSRFVPVPDYTDRFKAHFVPALELFDRIIQRIAERCRAHDVPLRLVVLAGRSFVEEPGSFSAQYQECFRSATVATARKHELDVVDVAGAMLERRKTEKARWFYPHDGHLTAAGHEVVTEILAAEMRRIDGGGR